MVHTWQRKDPRLDLEQAVWTLMPEVMGEAREQWNFLLENKDQLVEEEYTVVE